MKRRHTREELGRLLGVVMETPGPAPRCASGRHRPDSPVQVAQEQFAIWSAARAEANLAYDDWCAAPGAERYFVFRAAEDRADAAEAALEHAGAAARA